MKKIFTALILFLMIFSLVGCGDGGDRVDWMKITQNEIQKETGKK